MPKLTLVNHSCDELTFVELKSTLEFARSSVLMLLLKVIEMDRFKRKCEVIKS